MVSGIICLIQQFGVDHKIFVESFLMWNGTNYEWEGDKIVAHFKQDLEISHEKEEEFWRISGMKSR